VNPDQLPAHPDLKKWATLRHIKSALTGAEFQSVRSTAILSSEFVLERDQVEQELKT